jgi:hypothetical protein
MRLNEMRADLKDFTSISRSWRIDNVQTVEEVCTTLRVNPS